MQKNPTSISRQSYSILTVFLFYILFSILSQDLAARRPTSVESNTYRHYWQFLFLLESVKAPGQTEFHVHPFYGQYRNYERAYHYHYFLYPIFYLHGTNYWQRWTFLHLAFGDDLYHVDKGRDSDYIIPPVVMGKGKEHNENYFGIFPLWGKVYDLFGLEEVNYILFPIYLDYSYKDYKAYSFIWPIFTFGSGDNRSDTVIFPFYSRRVYKNKYERNTILWPLFQWGSVGLDKKEPRHYFFSLPLFGYKWSDQGNLLAWTALWLPLIGGIASYGRDYVKKEMGFNILWFLYQYHRSEDPGIRRLTIFPFYGYYRFGDPYKEYQPYYLEAEFFSPLYIQLRSYTSIMDTEYDLFLPFYWNYKRYYHKEREVENYLKIWPFFQYKTNTRGEVDFQTLSIFPFRSDRFDRAWGPLFSLMEYRRYENGDRYLSFLFRLYSQYWNENEGHYFLAGFEWHHTPNYWSFEFIGGLFGVQGYYLDNGETDWAFKLFWLNFSQPQQMVSSL